MKNNYGIGIICTSHYIPKNIQSNEALCKVMKDVTPDWILSKTGIKRRFIASSEESTSSMASEAALKAINGLPKFKPALQNGNPTSFPIVVPVAFNITE